MFRFFKFSVANIFRRKSIALLAIIGTLLGAGLMTVLLSLSNGMQSRLNSTLDKVAGDITVSSQDSSIISGLMGGGTPIPVEYISGISSLDHVKFVEGTIATSIPKDSLKTLSPIGSPLQGVNVREDTPFEGPVTKVYEGRMFEASDEAIIGKSLLEQAKLADNKITLGQTIEVPVKGTTPTPTPTPVPAKSSSKKTVTIPDAALSQIPTTPKVIQTKQLKIVGFFETGNDMLDRNVVTSIDTVRNLTGISSDQVTSIKVRADSSDNVETVANEIKDKYQNTDKPVQTTIAKNLLGDINKTMDIIRNSLLAISAVAAVAGGMSIFIIMLMSVTERMQEFGILKAGGWSNGNLLSTVLIESIGVALLGSLAGFGLGFGVIHVINQRLGETVAVADLQLLVEVCGFGVVMGILGGIYPALKAARVSPIETLKSL